MKNLSILFSLLFSFQAFAYEVNKSQVKYFDVSFLRKEPLPNNFAVKIAVNSDLIIKQEELLNDREKNKKKVKKNRKAPNQMDKKRRIKKNNKSNCNKW
ncbi:MAG: hypothetical protein H0V01_07330 [Bacteroidetes bacterium]|nr:hypothetical protein [Bacteroidota bacterium]HET6244170.1 hypothetical protein [Bacteroidia bacterium]